MKKRNMLTKVAALSMASLLTITGLPVAGLDGALAVQADVVDAYFYAVGDQTYSTSKAVKIGDTIELGLTTSATANTAVENAVSGDFVVQSPGLAISNAGAWTDVASGGAANASILVRATTGGAAMTVSGAVKDGTKTSATVNYTVQTQRRDISKGTDNTMKVKLSVVKSDAAVIAAGRTEDDYWAPSTAGESKSVDFNGVGYQIKLESLTVGSTDLDVTSLYNLKLNNGTDAGQAVYESKAGTYTLTLRPKDTAGAVYGEVEYSFTIGRGSMNDIDGKTVITINNGKEEQQYSTNGVEVAKTDLDVKYDGKKIADDDYNISYSNNYAVGKATLTVAPKSTSGIDGQATKEYTVSAKKVTSAKHSFYTGSTANSALNGFVIPETFTDSTGVDGTTGLKVAAQAYNNGEQIKPEITIYDAEKVTEDSSLFANAYAPKTDTKANSANKWVKLTANTDYTIEYGANKEKGDNKGTITIFGAGNYAGSKVTLTFDIVDDTKDISQNATATMKLGSGSGAIELANGASTTYTGQDIAPVIEVTYTDPETLKKKTATSTATIANNTATYAASTGDNEFKFKVVASDNKDVGTAKIDVIGINGYVGKLSLTFDINAKNISDNEVTVDAISAVQYDGTAKKPAVTLKNSTSKETLTNGKDYEVYYDNNIHAGTNTGIVTIAGKKNYQGTRVVNFTIQPYAISNVAPSGKVKIESIPNQVYTGSAIEPEITATFKLPDGSTQPIEEGTDYKITYSNNTGNESTRTSGSILLTGQGDFNGTTSLGFNIVPAANDLKDAVITLYEPTVSYDGDYHAASIKSVMLNDENIKTSVEMVKAVSEKDAGKYTVQIKGTASSNYGGVGETTFEITPKAVENATVTLDGATSFTYNGKKKSVKVAAVTLDGETEAPEGSYDVKGLSATDAGTKTVTVTFKGNYSGTAKTTWKINKAKQTIKVSPASKTFKASKVKKAKQTFTIKVTGAKGTKSFKSNSKKVTVTKAGKVTVKKGTKKGTYKITVKAAATKNYKAAASKTVTIKVK